MNYLLDSSALLAFYFGESGTQRVREILADDQTDVSLSVLTAAEFWSRLRAEGWEGAFDSEWRLVSEAVSAIIPISLEVVLLSITLRAAATARLPQIDALIAATAALQGATLIHRDPHFMAIPAHLLHQEMLPSP